MPNDMTWVPTSMRQAIEQLDVGESFSSCRRLALTQVSREAISTATSKMRNTLNSAMRRAMDDCDSTYTLETGNFLTTGALVIVGVVTRTE